jgi:MFS family permease
VSALTVAQVRRRFLVLHALRWLPSGLIIPVFVLLPLERGLTLAQVGLVGAAQGLLVLALELPTGGLADALGRRPVLLLSAVVNLASLALLATADSLALFALAFALQGIHRALDSGPLEAWYVDSALAADPHADIESGLSRGGVVIGLAIATGSLASGGLIALDPVPGGSALAVPVFAAIALQIVALVAVAVLLVERRPPRTTGALRHSLTEAPKAVGAALGLVRRSRIVLALVSVELFWGFGMVTFEVLLPVRLSDLLGDADRAGAVLGPATTAAWLASATGAALVPLLTRRIGAPWTGFAMRIAQGATVVGMALLAGPVGVLTAFLLCYVVHGAANPVHMGLLHRQVDGPYRGSVISLNSMMAQPAGAVGGLTLTALAGATSVSTAMLVGAGVLAAAAPLYLAARRGASAVPGQPPPRRS